MDCDARGHDPAHGPRSSAPGDCGEQARRGAARPVEQHARAGAPRQGIVDTEVVLGEAASARGEERKEPAWHEPGRCNVAVHPETGLAKNVLAFGDESAATVRGHVLHLRFAPRRNVLREEPRQSPFHSRTVVALVALMEETVQEDLVTFRLK